MRRIVAFTDGTYNDDTGKGAWGAVLLCNDVVVDKISGVIPKEKSMGSWQVASELAAAVKATEWAIKNRYESILIRHDLMMVMWTNLPEEDSKHYRKLKPISIHYRRKMTMLADFIDIQFQHVKGHSGDKYNDMADMLCKNTLRKAIGLITHEDHVAQKRAKKKYKQKPTC